MNDGVLNQLLSLKSNEARVLINELRKNRSKNVTLANQLVDYYRQLPSEHLATNVIQAISCHGDHRHFQFMIEALKDLAPPHRNQNQQYAFESALAGAGRLGLQNNLELMIDAGMPWHDGPIPKKKNPEKHIRQSAIGKERRLALKSSKEQIETSYRFRYRITHRMVAAILMILVKRDGRGTRDLHRNYSSRVLKFDGSDGKGAEGLYCEAERRTKK